MIPTEKINVFLNTTSKMLVGQLVLVNQKIYFKYHENFLKQNLNLSPFKLEFNTNIQSVSVDFFDGLFGVFSDSLPDGWGRLLQDRHLLQNNILPTNLTALDRLTLLNNNSAGALQYEPHIETEEKKEAINLNTTSVEIENILKNNATLVIDEILNYGGSSGGARPKIYVGYNPKTDELIYGSENLPKGFEHWIIKFPNSNDLLDSSKIEYCYNLMAKKAGILVNESKLFTSSNGNYFFGTKRFDRNENRKIHLHSVAGLLHDNFRLSTLDYGHIMDCSQRLENDFTSYEKILRLATFNVLAHNRDDHSKNFSFLMDDKGNWTFSPAYDLTFSSSSNGHHSTSIANEYSNPNFNHLYKLAKHFNVPNFKNMYEEVQNSVNEFELIARELDINKKVVNQIINKFL